TVVVVAKKHEYGVIEIAAFLGKLHEPANTVIEQTHGIVLLRTEKPRLPEFFFRAVICHEIIAIMGNREGLVIACR
ncbi:MAG: hypothetical protein MUC79_14465, partial [Thiobacillaceae bacterium]|nr:hypothetical protein [Thiobacillaceae bacterium]